MILFFAGLVVGCIAGFIAVALCLAAASERDTGPGEATADVRRAWRMVEASAN